MDDLFLPFGPQSPHPIQSGSTTWSCHETSGAEEASGFCSAQPKGSRKPAHGTLINSLRGGTRILLLMAHQPMGWTSTVPRLHQKSWLPSFSKPSYRSSTRYPGEDTSRSEGGCDGERCVLRPSSFHSLTQTFSCHLLELLADTGLCCPPSHGQSKPRPLTWKAVRHNGEN